MRSWPAKGGTNSFSQIIIDDGILNKCKTIIECLKKEGFYGLFDIELFVVEGNIVLNEINLRNSGDVYMGISQGYFFPYAWTEDYVGNKIDIKPNPQKEVFTMTECADVRNVLVKNVKAYKWLKDYLNSEDYALRFKGDNYPAFHRYLYYFKQYIKRKRL